MQKWSYQVIATGVGLGSAPVLEKAGSEGWELVAIHNDAMVFKRPEEIVSKCLPTGFAHVCANCEKFAGQGPVRKCAEFGVPMTELGGAGCGKFSVRKEVEDQAALEKAKAAPPAEVIMDEDSPLHWTADETRGQKRLEVKVEMAEGLETPSHTHRAVMIIDRHTGMVVQGRTDNVGGHSHDITVLGITEESDGHVHVFDANL